MSENKIFSAVKKVNPYVWLGIIVIIAVIRLCILFSLRDGHHVDETWSYGFANSYYNPQIYFDFEDSYEQNNSDWISGDVFKDYITVSEDHRFAFDSVLSNSRVDLSPPLYVLLLHFVCSFFPGTFSWWFAFSISLVCFIPSLIFIYLISIEMTESKFCGFLAVIYYVFSGCGTANFLFLRIYHLFTLFTLVLFWLVSKIIKNKKKNLIPYYACLLIPSILGYLTHFYFLVIAFAITFFGALALLLKKRLRSALSLCVIMLLSVVFFFVIYPDALRLLLPYSSGDTSGTGYYSYPYYFDLAIANVRFFTGTIGFAVSFTIFDVITVIGGLVFVAVVFALICFLFRNEQWMKKFLSGSKHKIYIVLEIIKNFIKHFDISIFVALLSVLFYLFVIPYSATLVNMGFTERYFFPAMSLFVVVYISFAGMLIKQIYTCFFKNKKICIPIMILIFALLIFQNIRSDTFTNMFRFSFMKDKAFSSAVNDRDCFVVIKSGRDMVWLSSILMNCNNVFIEYQEDVIEEGYTYPDIDSDCLYVLVKEGMMTDAQKSEFNDQIDLETYGFVIPETEKTVEGVKSDLEDQTGYSYELIDEYPSFIGMTDLYGCVDE